jgi:hypothetical protein
MMKDKHLGVRYIHNNAPGYGDVKGVVYAFQTDTKHAIFIEIAPRTIVEEKVTAATVVGPTQETIWVELKTQLTHIVKFVNHPTREGHYLGLQIWSTTPGWEIK